MMQAGAVVCLLCAKFFKENCIEDEEKVTCPDVVDELTTECMFTMSFVDGYSISKKDRVIADGYDPVEIGHNLIDNYVHQVLDAGVFHADPHQGNIMISHGIPVWIDFGMLGRISDGDVNIMFKCASLLKVVEEEDYCQEILDRIVDNLPDDEAKKMDIAIALRGIGRAEDAYDIMTSFESYVPDPYDLSLTMYLIGEYESALSVLEESGKDDQKSMILLTDIRCALGEFDRAMEIADKTIYYYGSSYDTLVNKCNVMFRMGNPKGSLKFAKEHLKESKRNNDFLAVEAYVMRINGRIPAAAGYASRVLKDDHTHIGALEVMAMCLVEKKSFINAKLLAGAINDADPGNPAAIRVLDACRQLSS